MRNCKPGDLAVVIESNNPTNIGSIVRVIGKHRNQKALVVTPNAFLWSVVSAHPMTYDHNGRLIHRKKGATPDSYLQPIHGLEKPVVSKRDAGLTIYEVSEFYTITDPNIKLPEIRSDVFNIWVEDINSIDKLVSAIEDCTPLETHFQELGQSRKGEIEDEIECTSGAKKKRLKALAQALDDYDYGWKNWLQLEGVKTLPAHIKTIVHWLSSPVDMCESDWFPNDWSGQGYAKSFFESLDADVRDALGVEIVEGCHPGSSYYAAELRNSVEDANRVARKLRLDFKFIYGI